MKEEIKQSIKWGVKDIEIYYNFIQEHNSTGYTICPVMAHQGDPDEKSNYDLIQMRRRNLLNKYQYKPQFIELKGRNKDINEHKTALVDLFKIQELQKYGKENGMEVYIVNIWFVNKKITIHKIDLDYDYSKDSELFKKINKQTAEKEIKGSKIMTHLNLYNVKQYDFAKCNL